MKASFRLIFFREYILSTIILFIRYTLSDNRHLGLRKKDISWTCGDRNVRIEVYSKEFLLIEHAGIFPAMRISIYRGGLLFRLVLSAPGRRFRQFTI